MKTKRVMRIVYVGWTGFGNLGDDVCRDLFIEHVQRSRPDKDCDLEILTATHQGVSEQALLAFRPSLVVLGAGSLFTPAYLQPLALAQKYGIPTVTWGTGFDKLSARRLDELLASDGPLPWQNEQEAAFFRRTIDACAWAGVRGPHTLKILQSAGCASRDLSVSGDPGLLLKAPSKPPEVEPWLKAWIDAKAPIVAVNWGTANNNVFGGDESSVAETLGRVIEHLARSSYKVLLFGVWGPDLSPIRKLAARFEGDPNVASLGRVPSGPLLAWILKHCRFSVNFKLHANVFTAAVGRPFVSLAYRSKCHDFAASMGCDDLVIRFDRTDLFEAVLRACELVEHDRKRIKERLRFHRRRYAHRLKALTRRIAELSLTQEVP